MTSKSFSWTAALAMSTFVLLWGSGAIATRWALDHSSVVAVLMLRYGLALAALLALMRFRIPPWLVVLACALAGMAIAAWS